MVALLVGCGPAPGGSTPGADHARTSSASATAAPAADETILRTRLTGGLAGLGGPGTVPDFSLYADGRAIVPDAAAGAEPGAGAGGLREHRLTPAALRRLLQDARAAGLDRSRTLDQPGVADAFTLEITFGSARTRIVMAGSGETDPAVRFSRERLNPANWAAADLAGAARPYEVQRLAALAYEDRSANGQAGSRADGQPDGQSVTRWPLGPIGAGTPTVGGHCVVVGGHDLATVSRLSRAARPGTRWLSGGRLYSIRFRPLLPDESTCADLARS